MINYTYESLFRQDSIDKQIHIVGEDINLANEDIFQGSFSLTEELNTEEDLVFGSCVSSCLKFTTSAIDDSFIGKFLTVSLTIDGHSDDDFNIGVYRVYEEKWTANRTKKEIVAYDRLYDINNMDVTDWYNALTFPISLANFRNSFFTYIGVTQKTATLVNDSFMVQETILPKALSGAMVLHTICELNGVFGRINRDNQFEYTQLGTSSVYSINPSMYTECKFEDYSVTTIDKVTIRQEENDIGGSYGSGDNALIIQGNFLAYGSSPEDLTTVATNIYSVVSSITYTPCEISCIGNPCVEIGDLVTIQKRDETTFTTYVLSRTLSNIQSMKDELSALGNEYRVNEINSVENDWLQLLGKTNKLTRTVEETISEVSDLNGSVTTLTQTSDYLVSEVQNINRELNGENLTWQGEGEPTLLNYPYWDFTSAFKCDGTKRCAPIYNDDMTEVEEGEEGVYPHHYYSEQDRQDHVRDLYIDLDTGSGYRFVKTNGVWNWQLIADSDFSILFNQITELRQDVDSIDLNVQNDEITIANHETRITHNESEITTQAGLISAKVSQTDHNGDNSFSWEMKTSGVKFTSNSTDVLTIGASGIKIQGNAEFTGKITATSGYIGTSSQGFSIGSSYIRNGMASLSDTTHNGVYVGTDGIALGKGAFKVTNAGVLTMNSGSINLANNFIVNSSGQVQIKSGSINLGGNFIVDSTGSATFNKGSINLGNKFTVNNNGNVTATSGKIGGWKLGNDELYLDYNNDTLSHLSGWASSTPNTASYIELGSEQVRLIAQNVKSYDPNGGKVHIEAVGGSGHIYLSAYTIDLNASSSIQFAHGGMLNQHQNLTLWTSDADEPNYMLFYGVQESMWTVSPKWGNGHITLGTPNHKWGQIYSSSATINTSDRNEKKYIRPLKKSVKDFVMALNPVSYQFKNGESGRTHYGLIAQDVEETMKKLGMTDLDFAGFCKDKKENSDDYIYGLRYEEFIAPLIKMIQLQQTEIEELKRKVG